MIKRRVQPMEAIIAGAAFLGLFSLFVVLPKKFLR